LEGIAREETEGIAGLLPEENALPALPKKLFQKTRKTPLSTLDTTKGCIAQCLTVYRQRSRKGEKPMLVEKKRLGVEELEAQVAFELPERELPAALLRIVLLSGNVYNIRIQNVSIDTAVQLCAALLSLGFVQKCVVRQ
jgi:hypothetical protein